MLRNNSRLACCLTILVAFCSSLSANATDGVTAGFVPEEIPENVTENLIWLRMNSVQGDRVLLDIVVTDVDVPIAGIAISLTYPAGFSNFIGCTDGELFPPGPCLAAEVMPGRVLVGRSALGPNQVTPVVGDKVIARLEFSVSAVGSGPIVFDGQNLTGGDASSLLDANVDPIIVDWFAGDLRGEQVHECPLVGALHANRIGTSAASVAEMLDGLRRFRDDVLLQSAPGRKLVRFYYENGAELQRVMLEDPALLQQTLDLAKELTHVRPSLARLVVSRETIDRGLMLLDEFQRRSGSRLRKQLAEVRRSVITRVRTEPDGQLWIELAPAAERTPALRQSPSTR